MCLTPIGSATLGAFSEGLRTRKRTKANNDLDYEPSRLTHGHKGSIIAT